MNLLRLLIIVAVAVIAYRLLRGALQSRRRTPPRQVATDDMLRCHRCGLHIPRNEALFRDGQPYCCNKHRDADE